MFTRNWYKALIANATKTSGKDTYIGVDGISTNLIADHEYYIQYGRDIESRQCASIYRMRTSYNGVSGGVVLGTGNTPPTLDDCKLSGDLVTGYIYSVAVEHKIDEHGATSTALYTITNTSNKTITIGEIAFRLSKKSRKVWAFSSFYPIYNLIWFRFIRNICAFCITTRNK